MRTTERRLDPRHDDRPGQLLPLRTVLPNVTFPLTAIFSGPVAIEGRRPRLTPSTSALKHTHVAARCPHVARSRQTGGPYPRKRLMPLRSTDTPQPRRDALELRERRCCLLSGQLGFHCVAASPFVRYRSTLLTAKD